VRASFLLRDRDAKFTSGFDEALRSEGVEIIRVPYRTPVANSHAKRWVGTVRREVLDHLLIFGCRHLEYVLREFIEPYEEARPHQGLGQLMPRHLEPFEASDLGPVFAPRSLGWSHSRRRRRAQPGTAGGSTMSWFAGEEIQAHCRVERGVSPRRGRAIGR